MKSLKPNFKKSNSQKVYLSNFRLSKCVLIFQLFDCSQNVFSIRPKVKQYTFRLFDFSSITERIFSYPLSSCIFSNIVLLPFVFSAPVLFLQDCMLYILDYESIYTCLGMKHSWKALPGVEQASLPETSCKVPRCMVDLHAHLANASCPRKNLLLALAVSS